MRENNFTKNNKDFPKKRERKNLTYKKRERKSFPKKSNYNEPTYKPGSVLCGYLSTPAVTDGLKRRFTDTQRRAASYSVPLSCFGWGLHGKRSYLLFGEPLPRLFTLTLK